MPITKRLDWRIEAIEPTSAADVKAALEKARDQWLLETPQISDEKVYDPLTGFNQLIADHHNADRLQYVKGKADHVAKKNLSGELDDVHSTILRQMNAGIACAVAYVQSVPAGQYFFRISLSGAYQPEHKEYLDERFSLDVDTARPPARSAMAVSAPPKSKAAGSTP